MKQQTLESLSAMPGRRTTNELIFLQDFAGTTVDRCPADILPADRRIESLRRKPPRMSARIHGVRIL